MKLIFATLGALLIASPAVAADQVLKCKGRLSEPKGSVGEGRDKRLLRNITEIEFSVSISDREITFQTDPKYDLGGTPVRSVLKLPVTGLDAMTFQYESVERMKRSKGPLIVGTLLTKTGLVTIFWREGDWRTLLGHCEFLVSWLDTVSPKAT